MKLLLALALLAGCQGQVPPVIDSVTVPTVPITETTAGTWTVPVTIQFHDDDDKVVAIRTTITATATRQQQNLPTGLFTGTISEMITLPSNTPKGMVEIDFVLIDESMLESKPSMQFVTLQ